MIKQWLILVSVIAFSLAANSGSAAERYMYKWKSADGELHYTERPPKGVEFEKIRVRAEDKRSAASSANAGLNKNANSNDDIKAADSSYQSWRQDNCKIAQQNMDILKNAGRVAVADGQGGKRLMTDEEKATNVKKAQTAIDKYCSENSTEQKK